MRLLVLGGSGQLGTQLRALALSRGVALFAPARSAVDLGDATAIARLVATEPWSALINAAGYTSVDRAESEQDLAFAINAEAAACLASETGKRGIPLIYVSTDYVFDGRKSAPYVESDVAAPLNTYGRSKLAGEHRVSAANLRHVILRTAWLYSPHGNNFVRTILRLAQEQERLTVVDDQLGCPTAARDLAQACLDIALRCAAEPDRAPYGVYHFADGGAVEPTVGRSRRWRGTLRRPNRHHLRHAAELARGLFDNGAGEFEPGRRAATGKMVHSIRRAIGFGRAA